MATNFKRRLIVSFSIIVGAAIIAAITVYFLGGNISTLADKIVAEKSLINQQTGALAVLAELKQQTAQAAVYQTAMDGLLPTQDGLIDFNQWIAGIGNKYQVVATVSFQDSGNTVAAPGLGATNQTGFSLSANGSLNNIIDFLNDIETKSPGFLLQITSFDLTSNNNVYQLTGQGIVFSRS